MIQKGVVVLWEKSQKKSSICDIFNKEKDRERERERAKDLNVEGGKKTQSQIANVSKRKIIIDLRFLTAVAFPSVVKMAF